MYLFSFYGIMVVTLNFNIYLLNKLFLIISPVHISIVICYIILFSVIDSCCFTVVVITNVSYEIQLCMSMSGPFIGLFIYVNFNDCFFV